MKIGVSGASGQLGRATLEELKARGARALVGISRTPENVPAPAEGRLGDYDRPETLVEAYRGLDRLVLIPSNDLRPGSRSRQFAAAIDAAVVAGVGHIVLVSAAGAREVDKSSMYADYWTGEQHLMRAAPRWTILRMNFYSESLEQLAQMALGAGTLPGLGESRVAFVSRGDVAAAAAGILLGEGHSGAIYNATGPTVVTGEERAALVAEVTGRPVRFAILTEDQLRAVLAQAGLPELYVNAIVDIHKYMVDGSFDIVTGDVKKFAGRPPRPLREVLAAALS
jgi:NAD(P)H dehydrogenase (quinone)